MRRLEAKIPHLDECGQCLTKHDVLHRAGVSKLDYSNSINMSIDRARSALNLNEAGAE